LCSLLYLHSSHVFYHIMLHVRMSRCLIKNLLTYLLTYNATVRITEFRLVFLSYGGIHESLIFCRKKQHFWVRTRFLSKKRNTLSKKHTSKSVVKEILFWVQNSYNNNNYYYYYSNYYYYCEYFIIIILQNVSRCSAVDVRWRQNELMMRMRWIRLRRRNVAVVIATVAMMLLVAAACLGLIDVTSSSLSSPSVDYVSVNIQWSVNN